MRVVTFIYENKSDMKKSGLYLLIVFAWLLPKQAVAQNERDTIVHYFVFAESISDGKKSMVHVTPVRSIVLTINPSDVDGYFKRDIERQYTEFLDYMKNVKATFKGYSVFSTEKTAKAKLDDLLKKYKTEKYQVVWVKNFFYD